MFEADRSSCLLRGASSLRNSAGAWRCPHPRPATPTVQRASRSVPLPTVDRGTPARRLPQTPCSGSEAVMKRKESKRLR